LQSVTWFVTIKSFWEVAAGWLPNYICILCKLIPLHQCCTFSISNSYISNATNLYVSWALSCSWLENLHMHILEFHYFFSSPFLSNSVWGGTVKCMFMWMIYMQFLCIMLFSSKISMKHFLSLLLVSIILFIDLFVVHCLCHPLKTWKP
jgi:hypothetical protein